MSHNPVPDPDNDGIDASDRVDYRFLSYWKVDLPAHRATLDVQTARCRNLEMAVIARALLDATWSDAVPERIGYHQKTAEARAARREARGWLLNVDPAHRDHVHTIVENAGLPVHAFRTMVRRFVVGGEDPAPLRHALTRLLG